MKKLMLVLATVGALSVTSAAHADILKVAYGPDYIYADGGDENPGPLAGFVYAGLSGVCADDNGSHAESDSPTCLYI